MQKPCSLTAGSQLLSLPSSLLHPAEDSTTSGAFGTQPEIPDLAPGPQTPSLSREKVMPP